MNHNVFFWLKADSDHQQFLDAVQKLLGINAIQSGSISGQAPTPERPVTDKTFSYHLSLQFATVENHDIYQDHPDHHVFVDACKDLWEKVVVYDSQPV